MVVIILEPLDKLRVNWRFTCSRCEFIPEKDIICFDDPDDGHLIIWDVMKPADYVETMKISKRTGLPGKMPLNLPRRCNKCKAEYRRTTRMRKRVQRIYDICETMEWKYKFPKLVTFALPSKWFSSSADDSYTTREKEMELLNLKLKNARKVLERNGVLGGIYVLECTYKWIPDLDDFTSPSHKFHAHVHMVCVAGYQRNLKEFCTILQPLGLGRISYEVVRSRSRASRYVAKYLVKDGTRSRSFGVFRQSVTKS